MIARFHQEVGAGVKLDVGCNGQDVLVGLIDKSAGSRRVPVYVQRYLLVGIADIQEEQILDDPQIPLSIEIVGKLPPLTVPGVIAIIEEICQVPVPKRRPVLEGKPRREVGYEIGLLVGLGLKNVVGILLADSDGGEDGKFRGMGGCR